MDELKKVEDEIARKKLEIKRLELAQVQRELQKKQMEERRIHDSYIVNSMDEEDYLSYFAERDEREKRAKETSYHDDY